MNTGTFGFFLTWRVQGLHQLWNTSVAYFVLTVTEINKTSGLKSKNGRTFATLDNSSFDIIAYGLNPNTNYTISVMTVYVTSDQRRIYGLPSAFITARTSGPGKWHSPF